MRKMMAFNNGEWKGRIRFVVELPPDDDENETKGEYDGPDAKDMAEIRVIGLGPRFKVMQRMLHELVHDCEEAEELDLPDATVDKIARYLARLFRNSPALTQFIHESSKRG